MGNRQYDFEITWCWKQDGNRPENIEEVTAVRSTTVQRAISKMLRDFNEGVDKEDDDFTRPADILVIDVRNIRLNEATRSAKRSQEA
jgi:hypothetical protein